MKKILIVVDMQNDFIDGSLGTKEAVDILSKVKSKIEEYRQSGHPVIYTRDTHTDDYLDTQEGKKLPVVHCIKDTPGWAILSQLDTRDSIIIDKPTFGSAAMMTYITENYPGADFELIGLCTDICVISNALLLKAFLPETRISVDASCCAGVTPASHKNALEAMRMCQIDIINE